MESNTVFIGAEKSALNNLPRCSSNYAVNVVSYNHVDKMIFRHKPTRRNGETNAHIYLALLKTRRMKENSPKSMKSTGIDVKGSVYRS